MTALKKLSVRLSLALALAGTGGSAMAGVVAGHISFLIGDVSLQQGQEAVRPLLKTDVVEVGQTVYTGPSGHLHLKMVDSAFISVRPNSRLLISQYEYDAANPANSKIRFSLEEGVARSITGKGGEANKAGSRLNTPLAAIGVRGTDFVVQADAAATRVSVQSGAVVMSPLGAGCAADTLGPCLSANSRVLTAAMRDSYLELRSRSGTPQLVPAEKALDAPNRIAPPRQEEPAVGVGTSASPGAGNGAGASAGDRLSARTGASAEMLSTVQHDIAATAITSNIDVRPPAPVVAPVVAPVIVAVAPVAPVVAPVVTPVVTPVVVQEVAPVVTPVVVTPVVVPPPVVVVATPPEPARFWWGRWQVLTGDGSIAAAAAAGREIGMSNEMFGLFKEAGYPPLELNSGTVKFQLAQSEAYIVNGAVTAAATVSNPSLSIDFGARRFSTGATFTAASLAPISVSAQGPVSFQGLLIADGNSATTNVVGNVTSRGEQAGILYKQVGPNNTTAFGATRWVR